MSGYTKLFKSFLASTIWREDDKTRIVWITLLAMADKKGRVEGSVPGLTHLAHVSVTDARMALGKLTTHYDSETPEAHGCLIATDDGGWQLIHHRIYRANMVADERREYLRIKQAERRARLKHARA